MSSTPADIRIAAMRWLVRREYSEFELVERLCRRKFDRDVVENVVADMVQEDLVCDQRFTDALIHVRLQRGYGPLKITAQLRERGIAQGMIESSLNMHDPTWIESGRKAWQRKFPQVAHDYTEWARQARFIAQRGFTSEQTRAILGDFKGD